MKRIFLSMSIVGAAVISWSFINPAKSTSEMIGCAPASTATVAAEPDSVFLKLAASSGMMEVQLGNIAVRSAASQQVRDFGAMMVRDHTLANTELMAIAARLGIQIPPMPVAKHQRHIDHVANLTGPEFDKAYMKMMVEAHKDDIDEFEDHATKAKSDDVKAFAAKNLPILKMHRDSAQAIRKALNL